MKRFLAGLLCSAMLCTEILSASVFATENTEQTKLDEQISIEETVDASSDEGQLTEVVNIADTEDLSLAEKEAVLEQAEETEEAGFSEDAYDENILTATYAELNDKPNTVAYLSTIMGKAADGSAASKCFTVSANELRLGINPDTGRRYDSIPWQKIVIPSYVDANGDEKIQDSEIVRKIPNDIFVNDTMVRDVVFAENSQIVDIAAGAFKNCSIETISFPAPGLKIEIDDGNDLVKVVGTESNPEECFITEIKENTFFGSMIKVANVATTKIVTVGEHAFENSKLESFIAPGTLETIKAEAFKDCKELQKFDFTNVKVIESKAFMNCKVLGKTSGTVTFSDRLRSVGDNAFESCGFGILDMSVAEFLGGDTYTAFGKGVFKDCQNMTEITLPYARNNIEGITDQMFSGCIKLTNVHFAIAQNQILPSFGETIGHNAFDGCTSLVTIEFPDDIKEIKSKAFIGCNKLKEVQIGYYNFDADKIADDAFPTNDPLVKLKGRSNGVERYCQEHSKVVVYVNIAQENKIIYAGGNYKYEASADKAKNQDEVTLKIMPSTGYALGINGKGKLISAVVKDKSGKVKQELSNFTITLVSCTNDTQVFSFKMPYLADKDDTLTITPNVASVNTEPNKTDEKTLTATAPDRMIDGFTTLADNYITTGRLIDGSSIKFRTRGEQFALLMEDGAHRRLGPWRFKFESTDTTVATVTSEGVVTAGSNNVNKNAQIIVTLVSTGKAVALPVSVEQSVLINKMDFQFERRDPRTGKYIYELPSRVSRITEGVDKYEMAPVKDPVTGEVVIDPATGEAKKEKVLRHYELIVVPRTKVKKGAVPFTVEVLPKSESTGDKSYVLKTIWSTRDDKIAAVEKETVVDNMNKITIQSTAVGETEIRVKVINDHLDKSDPNREYEYGFIVRVDDDIPRLTEKSFTMNTYKDKGYPLKIVEGYKTGAGPDVKYEIANNKLWVAKVNGKEMQEMTSDFIVTYDAAEKTYYIKETDKVRKKIAEGESVEYKNLYLCGQIRNNDDVYNEGNFEIPFGTITVTKLALETKISLKGSINTFYNAKYEDENHSYSGAVTVYQSNWDEKVEKYYLVTAEHHGEIQRKERTVQQYQGTNPDSSFYDELQANFTFGYISEKTGTVPIYRTRTDELVKNKAGETVTSGYLYIKYEGYKDCLYQEISIPVKKSKPNYMLDVSSATASTLQSRQQYNVLLVDKSTKKLPVRNKLNPDGTVVKNAKGEVQREYVDLLGQVFYDEYGILRSKAKYEYNIDTEGSVFDKTRKDFTKKIPKYVDLNDSKKKEETKEYTSIPITVKEPYNSKAMLVVQLYNWSEPIEYTFTLKTTNAFAKASVKPGTVVLYKKAEKTPAEFEVVLNQNFAKLHVDDVSIPEGIEVKFEQDDDNKHICKGIVSFKNGSSEAVEKKKYKIITKGTFQYGDGVDDIYPLTKDITFTVDVKDTMPEIKPKSTTFNLNTNVAGVELIGTKYTLKNIPAGDNEYAIISDNSVPSVNPSIKLEPDSIECLTKDPNTKAIYAGIADKIDLRLGKSEKDGEFDMMMVGLKPGYNYKYYEGKSYQFLVKGVKVTDKYKNEITLKDFKIKVSIKKNLVSVTQKATGTINPIDPKSDTVFIPTFKNYGNVKIISANYIEVDKYGKVTGKSHFKLASVSQNTLDEDKMQNISTDKKGVVLDNQFMLTTNGVEIEKDTTYYGIIRYQLQGVNDQLIQCDTKKFKVSLSQKIPGVGLSFVSPKGADSAKMSTVMYAGSDANQVCTVMVMPKAQTNAVFDSIGVFKSETPTTAQKDLERAFEPRLFKVEPPKGYTARETNSLRTEALCYKVYALIDGDVVAITKQADATIDVADVDPTSSKKYAYSPWIFDEDAVKAYTLDTNDIRYYREAVAEMQKEECKYYKSFSTNTEYEKKDGHYFVKIKLLASNAFKKNKATDITFEIKYKNQIKKTTGTKFKINVTLKE